jgi:26S proteasome regulatory subunit N11
MLKHGRAGLPLEVMGLMLGEFVDDYTVRFVDVFAMPQSGTGVSLTQFKVSRETFSLMLSD